MEKYEGSKTGGTSGKEKINTHFKFLFGDDDGINSVVKKWRLA